MNVSVFFSDFLTVAFVSRNRSIVKTTIVYHTDRLLNYKHRMLFFSYITQDFGKRNSRAKINIFFMSTGPVEGVMCALFTAQRRKGLRGWRLNGVHERATI